VYVYIYIYTCKTYFIILINNNNNSIIIIIIIIYYFIYHINFGSWHVIMMVMIPDELWVKAILCNLWTVSRNTLKDGTISVDIPARAVGETFEFNFGPAPDYVLRAPWAPTERHYDFGRSDGRALHVPVPAGQKRVFLIPKGLMLDIPNGTSPGAVLCFKHPDKAAVSNWFTTRLPKNWRAGKRYLPVRLPKEEYQFEYGSGNFFQDMCQQFLLLIEQMWEDFTQMCQNCRFWR